MKNKIIYFLLLIILVEGLFLAFRPNLGTIRTDSGWDSDYGGGGSDWSSGSSSSWDSYDSGGSGSSGGSGEFTLATSLLLELFVSMFYYAAGSAFFPNKKVFNIVLNISRPIVMFALEILISKYLALLSFFLVFPVFIIGGAIASKTGSNSTKNVSYSDVKPELLEKYGITDLEALKQELYKIFVDVQKAWMEFDYDALAKLCSNELYNSYKSDLETLKLKNGKNIMDSFKCLDVKVYNIFQTKEGYSLNVYMQVEFHDYVINTTNNNVIRGDKNRLYQNQYKLAFSKNNIKLDKCPSCGAPIKDTSSQKCDHCGNTLVNNNTNYVLENKGRI